MKNNMMWLIILSIFTLVFSTLMTGIVFADEKEKKKESKKSELESVYDDLYNGDWEVEYADWGVSRGVIKVYEDNTIRVNEEVNEIELLEMIANYVGLDKVNYLENPAKLYEDLRNIGIMSSGTLNLEKRESVATVEEGLLIAMTLHDSDKYKNRKDKVNEALKIINENNEATKLELNTELMKVDVLRILKSYESKGSEIIVSNPKSSIGSNWKEAYVGDILNKRISYLEQDSGLLINVIEVSKTYKKDNTLKAYYNELTGEDLTTYENAKYIVNVRNVGNEALDILGLSVLVKDGEPKVAREYPSYVGLNGKSNITTVISGNSITELKVVIGDKTKDIDLSKFKEFSTNSMYITDSKTGRLQVKQFYLTEDLKDVDYNLEQVFSKEYGND